MEYKLCYVHDNILYFTDDFEHVHSDDWNDAPYEHNAEPPYPISEDYTEEENRKYGYSNLRYIAYMPTYEVRQPCDGHLNSPYSVEDINKGAIAWLYHEDAGGLMAGATLGEAFEWFKNANIRCGELVFIK